MISRRNAFLLLEVTLTIAILSIGLVFVIRSLGMSMKVARSSFNYAQAINLADEKMFDLELEAQPYLQLEEPTHGLESTSGEGSFVDNERFNWKYSAKQLSDVNLGKVVLDIYWQEGKREGGFDLVTYIKIK
ncbi:hypothetical protein ACFL2Y_03525 [Candidatus Omnitrophota bacterium]